MRVEINLIGDGYTEAESLTMKAEIIAYATSKNLHGGVLIITPL